MRDRKGLCREGEGRRAGRPGSLYTDTAVPKVSLTKSTVMGSGPSSREVAPGRVNNGVEPHFSVSVGKSGIPSLSVVQTEMGSCCPRVLLPNSTLPFSSLHICL